MATISLCMIVKNEEATLARCLDCVKDIVDEIIIVDTGSTDQTKLIANNYTHLVYDFTWIDDFSAARNFSFSKATMDYCFWLDADDILLESEQEKLKKLKESLTFDIDIVMMQYQIAWDEFNNPTFTYYRERLIRNNKKYLWEDEIHEVIPLKGNIIYSDVIITHKKVRTTEQNRNIELFEKLIKKGKQLSLRQQFYYARELFYHQRYQEAIIYFENFIKNQNAWLENRLDAIRILSICYAQLNMIEKILPTLLSSLELDTPRAEICCEIGQYFLNKKQYKLAVFWYELALSRPQNTKSGAFILSDCYGYIPSIQLCVCYYHLGKYEIANDFNEKAGKLKPNDNNYKMNKKFFEKLLKNERRKNEF